jgi:hypothetical protein
MHAIVPIRFASGWTELPEQVAVFIEWKRCRDIEDLPDKCSRRAAGKSQLIAALMLSVVERPSSRAAARTKLFTFIPTCTRGYRPCTVL